MTGLDLIEEDNYISNSWMNVSREEGDLNFFLSKSNIKNKVQGASKINI